MHFFNRYRSAFAVIAAAFVFAWSSLISLTGCAAGSDLFAYTEGAAEFTLVFPSVSGDTDAVRCLCVRDDSGNVTLTASEPARMAGFTVIYADGITSAGSGDMMIPLSAEAAEGLTQIFDLLTMTGSAVKSADGLSTVIDTGSGTVTLGEELVPVSVTAGEITVAVEGWEM